MRQRDKRVQILLRKEHTLGKLFEGIKLKVQDNVYALNEGDSANTPLLAAYAGLTGSEQIAFACMRLLQHEASIGYAIQKASGGVSPGLHDLFAGAMPGRRNKRLDALFMVMRSVIWADNKFRKFAYEASGYQKDVCEEIETFGSGVTASEEFLKEFKSKKVKKLVSKRTPATRGKLTGSQRWDILPEWRFGLREADSKNWLAGSSISPLEITRRQLVGRGSGIVTKPGVPENVRNMPKKI